MSRQYKENYKRVAGKSRNNIPDNSKDLILYGDLTDGVITSKVQYDTTYAGPAQHSEGLTYWNSQDKTVNVMTDVDGTSIQVGQELMVRVVNKTGGTILNGEVVYIDGAQGNRPTIGRADASDHDISDRVIGVATNDIENNQNGYVTTFGLVRDLDTSSYSEGEQLWIDVSIPGSLTNVRPLPPNHALSVGFVIKSHNTQGIILVRLEEHAELKDLNDVSVSGVADGQMLIYNSTLEYWRHAEIPVGVAVGSTTGIYNVGRLVQGGTYTSSTTINLTIDDYLTVITGSGVTVNLPAAPANWQTHVIKDGAGHAATYNYTIDGNGNTIDGEASQTVIVDYGAVTLVFNTVEWSIV